jgi:hypothetical protein
MKKILLALLLITALCFSLISCNNTNSNNNDKNTPVDKNADNSTTAENEEDVPSNFVGDDLDKFDFGGYTFRALSRFTACINVEEELGDLLDDAIYRRNRKVEERFNFKIKETPLETGDMSMARKSLMAGDNAWDFMIIQCNDAFVYAQEGLIQPINALPYVNIDKPYWDKWLTSQWTVANKSFFASSALDIDSYNCTGAFLFNKKIAAELGITDLYQLASDGKWTFDKFAEYGVMARKDLNGDGVFDANDRHGYLSALRNIPPNFWISGGVKSISKDMDDIPYMSANEENFLKVWDKLVEITLKNSLWYAAPKPDELDETERRTMFKNNQSLFYGGGFGDIPRLRDMEIDFGILPYPKYDEAQDRYYTRIAWAELFCIPGYSDDQMLERTSVILEALSCESAKSVIPVYYEIALKTKFTRDEESAAMIDLLFESRVFDFGDTFWCGYLRDGLFAQIYQKKPETVVSALEKLAGRMQKEIDKTVNTFLDLD